MRRKAIFLLLTVAGLLIGWFARGLLAEDACRDAGGMWLADGGLCAGVATELTITKS